MFIKGDSMDYSKYYEARDIVKSIISKDMLGPLSEDEIINDYPVSYYLVGKLYPQDCRMTADRSSAEDIGNTEEEQTVALDEGRVPASMGLSFALKNDSTKFAISAKAALYKDIEEVDKDTKKLLWKRSAVELDFQTVLVSDLKKQRKIEYLVDNELKLMIMLHKIYPDGGMSVTATLVNANKMSRRESRFWINQHTYFQPEIIIKGKTDFFSDIRKNVKLSVNKETLEMEMLYSKYKNYVTGHGCAARFRFDGENLIIQTTYLPEYELKQMMPRQNVSSRILSMKYLSRTDKNTLISELSEWLDEYKVWIEKLKERRISKEYIKSANDNINRCMTTYETIKKSIACFGDEKVYKSFIYANEVMFMQRKQTLSNRGIDVPDDQIRWYPFQLAFFLQEIVSFAVPSASERKNVDLLWFPTGGGKTEAYLGIAAFVIFLRRLRNGLSGAGVSIIMRYTLRLLTFQQFERASAMICACELLRKKYEIPGGEISIGLWAGQALTPNTIEMADKILNGYSDPDCESSNPKQLEKCPWCGKKLNYSCDNMAKRMHIKCENTRCAFTKGLPIYLIDEEIYKFRPSFLVATVDKFAQVVQREQTFSLFGKNTDCVPPELIIQDELHLISGPLGTITGIYEAAFKKLCTYNGIGAKVIASTATIKNAKEQINSLYAADFTQFPPQALDADDSYFAVKSTRDNKPARLYMGCMGTGTSAPMVMIRVMAATLYATRYLESLDYDEEIIDSFWTITSYFNTLRELGGAIIRVVDNVQDRFAYLKETKFKKQFPINGGQTRYDTYIELTSREKSENIGRIIQNDLVIKYTKEKTAMPIDFILASNMISVGIDISRLNTMLVVGQPKTTAEYIQATSRVGRETPGFVFTMYNYMRSRDKSYFEQFSQYHEAFYKYVEATSVTPFAERARDRALQTLYIILCRYYIDILSDEEGAERYNRNIPGLKEVRDYIYEYVSRVDPDELENVAEDIEDIELEWEALATKNPGMTYRKRPYKDNQYLFKDDFEEDSRFRIMNSMRSVETSVQVVTRE